MDNTVVDYFSKLLGFEPNLFLIFLIFLIFAAIIVATVSLIGGLGTYAERKISADMQARIGPNRVGPYGLLQFLADGVKMIMKEDTTPNGADRFLFNLAPLLCLVGVFATLAVFPFSSGLTLVHLNVGVFYILAISSLIGLGIFIGGYSSNSKWSLLGGMRAASQIVSYEIPVALCIISVVLMSGSLSLKEIIAAQSGTPLGWNVFHNPFMLINFVIYFIASLAESNRAPFDLPEAESELVSGYHTEFSGMKFAFFALAEYVEVFVLSGLAVSLFLGGYNVPFGLDKVLEAKGGALNFIGQILESLVMFSKIFVLYYIVIAIRWTLPRLRVDQLMTLCWKYLTPIAMFNLVGTVLWLYYFNGQSFVQLLIHLGSGSGAHH